MKTFQEIKQSFIDSCKVASACNGEFKKLLAAEDEARLIAVLRDNFSWCCNEKVLNADSLALFDIKLLNDAGIYFKQTNKKVVGIKAYLYMSSVVARGNSSVVAWETAALK